MSPLGSSPRGHRSTTPVAVAAICLSLMALVFSMSGFASAKPAPTVDKVGVRLLTTATGSMMVTADGEPAAFVLDNATFTQEAGATVLMVTNLSSPDLQTLWPYDLDGDGAEPDACGADVLLGRTGGDVVGLGEMPDTFSMGNGGEWHGRFVLGLTPSDTAVSYTLNAEVFAGCDGVYDEGEYPTFTVEFEVAVLALG